MIQLFLSECELNARKLIELSKNDNSQIRLRAVKQMCPCKLRDDVDLIWNRIFEMVDDDNDDVRYQILHTICDGSPNHLEDKISEAMEKFNHDTNSTIRRKVHKVMAIYLKTGKWNVL